MKKIVIKSLIVVATIVFTQMILNSYNTSINNTAALLQLEDSNHALAAYNAYQKYAQISLVVFYSALTLLVFKKEIFRGKKK